LAVRAVCAKLGMSRQNFYARRRRRKLQGVDGELVLQWAREERRLQPRLGARKLLYLLGPRLKEAGMKMGRDRFFALMKEAGLLLEALPRDYARTTCSAHDLPVYPNLAREAEVSRPNELLVADLTYVRTEEGFVFVSLVTDRVSRKIVGYHCGEDLGAQGCLRALEMALASLPEGARAIHHSDRGTQYCSREYIRRLEQRGLAISMTEKNHCAENALAERVNGILKAEYGLGGRLKNKAQARRALQESVWLYNERRPHSALGYKTPEQAHSLAE